MKIFTHRQYTYNLAGRFSFVLVILFSVFFAKPAFALNDLSVSSETIIRWDQYVKEMEKQEHEDYRNGISYIISGSIALAGGLLGDSITHDFIEKGIYTVFQTIGIASIGYGAYVWKIGSEDRNFYKTVERSKLTSEQKTLLLRNFNHQKKITEKNERFIKAITHGMIAGLNFYSASRQKNDSVKNGLAFVGGVNLLASLSFMFEF